MTIGNVAALIAAVSFAALVVFLSINLTKFSNVMSDIQETVRRLNTTIDVVTKDVDNLSIEVEGLLNKANTLVDDVNGKLSKTDPLFTAIGDLGITVSDLNDSTKNFTVNLLDNVGGRRRSPLNRIVKSTRQFSKMKDKIEPSVPETELERRVEGEKIAQEIEEQLQEQQEANETLRSFINKKPSSTAGEIRIN